MKQLCKLVGIASLAAICGCATTSCCSTPDKPVAPETYVDGQSDSGDPQLPAMKPWWKF